MVVNPPIEPGAGVDDTVCFGSPINLTGTLSVATDTRLWSYLTNGISPTPTVQFLPAANNLTPTVNVNQPGLYSFILMESNPICGTARDTVNIFVKQMDINHSSTNPSCFGYADGSITLSGTDATQYSYDNGANWSSNSTGTGFTAGTYNVCVRDANLCQACTTVTLSEPAEIVLSVSNDTLICQNGSANLVATAVGGNSYTYEWPLFPSNSGTQVASPLNNTEYFVQAFSELGCPSNTESINVNVRPAISGTISMTDTVCPGYPTTIFATAADGFGAPYTFAFSNGSSVTGANADTQVSPNSTTNYTVTITDGCESSPLVLTTTIVAAPVPEPQFTVDEPILCEPAVFTLVNTTDPSMNASNYWLISDGQSFINMDTIRNEALYDGNYDVQLVVTSPFGCVDSVTYPGFLNVQPIPTADFKYSPNPVTVFNTEVNFSNYSSNATIFQWYFEGATPVASILEDPTVNYPDGVEGQYKVMLVATSELGCADTTYQTIIVLPEVLIFAPNAFTPDGDEFNQAWKVHIEGIDIFDFELLIFNRWGEIVWESRDPEVAWDGTYKGKVMPQGVYNWVIRTKDSSNDGKHTFNGYITLIR